MTTRLIVFNDPHISDRPPIGRKDGYREQILAKLAEIVRICGQSPKQEPIGIRELSGGSSKPIGQVDPVQTIAICTGDLFHQKRPSFTSHYLVGQLQQVFWPLQNDLFLLPGNHDTGPAGIEGLASQPLSVLDGGPIHVVAPGITDVPQVVVTEDCAIVWRPYSYERDADPTYYQLDETERAIAEGAPHVVMVAHGSIVPPGEVRPYPHVPVQTINLAGIDVLLAAHIHEDLGIHLVDGTWFCNVGAIGRTQRTQANYDREVAILEVTLNAGLPPAIVRIPLQSVLPAGEVFHELSQETDEGVPDEIVEFAGALARGLNDETVPIEQLIEELDLDKEVKKKVVAYLEEAGL